MIDLFAELPSPADAGAAPIRTWMVGMTTAPRLHEPTACRSLASVIAAGWDEGMLFAEPESPIPDSAALGRWGVVQRPQRMHAFGNAMSALGQLYYTNPHADAYLMLQDDALFADANVRTYLEKVLWPREPSSKITAPGAGAPDTFGPEAVKIGKQAPPSAPVPIPSAVSLYTSTAYHQTGGTNTGWRALGRCRTTRWVWGAVAFVFPRETVRALLASRYLIDHRATRRGDKAIDVRWGEVLEALGPVWFPWPSLVQHIGRGNSSIWTKPELPTKAREAILVGAASS